MKKKFMTFILLFCVAAVWGVIFYRIYMALDDDGVDVRVLPTQRQVKAFALANHMNDKVALDLNYRNPFSEGEGRVAEVSSALRVNDVYQPRVENILTVEEVQWPVVKYKGYTNNRTSNKCISLIEVNGITVALTEGQAMEGVKLLKNEEDYIKVIYKSKIKYLRLE